MASRLEQVLSCPICCELFRDPVILSCSHSFCKVCLENWWKDKPLNPCSVCMRRSSRENPPLNLALKNLVETFTDERKQTSPSPAQPECSHSEQLRFFCVEHQDLVCLVCRDSSTHNFHSFRSIEDAARELREQLRRDLTPLQDDLMVLARSRAHLESSMAHITAQGHCAQTQIGAQFEKLHRFLREEEESRMKTLREEEEQKTQRMSDILVAARRDTEAVSQTVSETEELLRTADDASFLLQYKTAAKRLQQRPLVEEPQMGPGALIDQAKHLGNLGFNIWRNMKSLVQFYPVLLDPNNAGSDLVVSEDLSSMKCGERQEVPQNPERNKYHIVLGSERFVSGTHSWDVEVGEIKHWVVGVSGCVQSGEETEKRVWFTEFIKGKYLAASPSGSYKHLSLKLQRVGVKLDFDTKTVTFTDPDTNTDLYTESFTEGLTPYFNTLDKDVPLKILPKNITVTE